MAFVKAETGVDQGTAEQQQEQQQLLEQQSAGGTSDSYGIDELMEEATATIEALGLGDGEESAKSEDLEPRFAAGRGRVLPSSGRLRIPDEDEEMKALDADITMSDLFASAKSGTRNTKAQLSDSDEELLLNVGEQLSVSAWSYDTNEFQQDREVFGSTLARAIHNRKVTFANPVTTASGAKQRLEYMLRSKKSWLSTFRVDFRNRSPASLEVVQLNRAYGNPTSKHALIEMARAMLRHLGYNYAHEVTLMDVHPIPLMEMIQVYQTFMKYVKILVRLQLLEYEPEIRFAGGAATGPALFNRQPQTGREDSGYKQVAAPNGPVTSRQGGRKPRRNAARRVHIDTDDDDALSGEGDTDTTLEGVRMYQYIPLDNIPQFHGKEDQPEEAKKWLEEFTYLMSSAQWGNERICKAFSIAMKRAANHWYQQLPRKTKSSWRALRAAFVKTFCDFAVQTAASRYYNARRGKGESATEYMRRLNNYARKAGIEYDPSRPEAEDHVMQFLSTLGDEWLAQQLLGLPDIEAVDQRMQRLRIMDRNIAKASGQIPPQGRGASSQEPHGFRQGGYSNRQDYNQRRFGRNGGGVREHGGRDAVQLGGRGSRGYQPRGDDTPRVALGEREDNGAEYDNPDYVGVDDDADCGYGDDMDEDDSEGIFAAQAGTHNRTFQEATRTQQPGYTSTDILPICRQCNRGRHLEANCFLNRTCLLCKRRGHDADRCLFVCKVCLLVHPVGECGYKRYLDGLTKWVEANHKRDDLPAELREMRDRLNL